MKKILLALATVFTVGFTATAQTAATEIAGVYKGDLYISVGVEISETDEPLTDQTITLEADSTGSTVTLSLANFAFAGEPLGDIVIPDVPVEQQADGSIRFGANDPIDLSFLDGEILATAKINESTTVYNAGQLTANLDVVWTNTFDGNPVPIYVRFISKEKTAGIGDITLDAPAKAGIYTLSGTRVNASSTNGLAKGIYIVNGKKTIIR